MFGNLWNKIKAINVAGYFIVIILGSFIVSGFAAWYENGPLVESKGGIQNHLVWDIKGECYFVRPATNTVYLIRVQDCDKGNK
jgi:hypothetical protein